MAKRERPTTLPSERHESSAFSPFFTVSDPSMVRLKSRYIVAIITFPSSVSTLPPSSISYSSSAAIVAATHDETSLRQEASRRAATSSTTIPHTAKPPILSPSEIYHALTPIIQSLYGVTVSSTLSTTLQIRHYSPSSGLLLIRAPTATTRKIWSALTLLHAVKGVDLAITVKGVAGSSRTTKKLIERVAKNQRPERAEDIVEEFLTTL